MRFRAAGARSEHSGLAAGVVRQLVNFFALLLAYVAAIISGRIATPLVHPLGYPDLLVSVLAGAVFGGVVYLAVAMAGAVLFRQDQRAKHGVVAAGVWRGGVGDRISRGDGDGVDVGDGDSVFGDRGAGGGEHVADFGGAAPGVAASPMAVELAQFKQSMDSGPAGMLINGTDPVPQRIYLIVEKMTRVISSVDSMRRFVTYPGTQVLSSNPRIVALQKDPEIAKQVVRGNIMGLLGNPKIVAAVNDPGLESLVRRFELEKALDYALASNEGRKKD